MTKIAIIGNGWVGKSMQKLFPNAYVYTPSNGMSRSIIDLCDIAFVCVPTPLGKNSRLDTSIVEQCVSWLESSLIIIRSTVNPGDCKKWMNKYKKNIVFQPEYLGETPNHPLLNEKNTPFIILGGHRSDTKKLVELYATIYNSNIKIRQVSLYEAEVIKLTENRAIAFKVMQLHELYKICEKAGVNYYIIRDAVYGDDPRFNLWFSFIYPEKLGFQSSKCLKKDVPAWCAWAESVGIDPDITKLLVEKSKRYAK